MAEEAPAAPPVIGRFADPTATDTLTVPGCHCLLGTHKQESTTYRTELGAGEWESVQAAGMMAGDGEYVDYGVSNDVAIAKSVNSWTLVTNEPCAHRGKPHGKHEPMPISRRTAALLGETIRQALLEAIQAARLAFTGVTPDADDAPDDVGEADLPNEPSAPSPGSSRGSASPTRKTKPQA